ncbi:AAA family ATPase [Bacteroidota bacterium]
MKVLSGYEKARLYIESQSEHSEEAEYKRKKTTAGPCITISRQTGIGAVRICNDLVNYLQPRAKSDSPKWTYFDRELIDKVIEDHNIPERFKKFITDTKSHTLDSIYGELMGMQPSKVFILKKTSKTILRLVEYGNVIIVGRGAQIITAKIPKTFHVRLIAPLNDRIENARILYGGTVKESEKFIRKEDIARRKYIKTYFHKDIEDPLLYNLIINTRGLEFNQIGEMIGHCVVKKYHDDFRIL